MPSTNTFLTVDLAPIALNPSKLQRLHKEIKPIKDSLVVDQSFMLGKSKMTEYQNLRRKSMDEKIQMPELISFDLFKDIDVQLELSKNNNNSTGTVCDYISNKYNIMLTPILDSSEFWIKTKTKNIDIELAQLIEFVKNEY